MGKILNIKFCLVLLVASLLIIGCSSQNIQRTTKPWTLNYQVEDTIWLNQLSIVKRAWKEANQELLKIFPQPKCPSPRLFLVSNEQFSIILYSSLKPNGFYAKENIFLNFSITNSYEQFSSTLKHELTHAYLDCLTAGKSPAWFDEGLAQYMEGHYSEVEKDRDRRMVYESRILQITELENSFALLPKEKAITAYKQSKLMFAYLLKVTNSSRIRHYLEYLKTEEKDAFSRAFALSLKDFYVNSSRDARRN